MRERTLTIGQFETLIKQITKYHQFTTIKGSAGKIFGITGAKTGWIIGNEQLVKLCTIAHTNSLYVLPTLIQVQF